MNLSGIYLVADDLEDSVNFYTQTLGLKEIERTPDTVALQGKDISSCLLLLQKDADMDEGLDRISFTVENLDRIVQKLENADVDVKVENYDDGTQTAYFSDPKNENIRICLTTDDPPDMSGGEETEIRINRIILKVIVGLALPFYTQILGLKEIEGWTDEDNQNNVGLQAGERYIELQEVGWFESRGFDSICFEVDNLYNAIQKLEAAGVDVDLGNVDEHGWRLAFFKGPDNVNIVLGGLDQAVSDEETDNQDGDAERPSIGEKVRFWEEQDRINQELIPRVIRQNELLTQHIAEHDNLQQILSDTMQKALSEQAQQYESALDTAQKQLNETHEQITQKALSEQVENLRQEARQTRNRLTTIAAGSAIIAIAALIVAVLT